MTVFVEKYVQIIQIRFLIYLTEFIVIVPSEYAVEGGKEECWPSIPKALQLW